MFRILFHILFGQQQATFATDLPLDIAVARLGDVVGREPSGTAPAGNAVVGDVLPHRVVLRYYRHPLTRNAFRPCFIGRFEVTGQRLELRGVFRSSLLVRAFMIAALGFLVLWISATLAYALRGPANLWLFPAVGTGLLFVACGLPIAGRKLAQGDEEIVSRTIMSALNPAKAA